MKATEPLCVIIPMYNESRGASRCVEQVMVVIRSLPRVCLLVVDDGSHDRTWQILRQAKSKYGSKLILVRHACNRGYGAALMTGVKEAHHRGFTFALFMDSDLTNDPRDIPRFLAALQSGADCVKASRFIRGGQMVGVPYHRQLISRAGNLLAATCFRVGLSDCTNGFRAVRLSLLTDLKPKEHAFAIILEELYALKIKGAKFVAIPVTLTARRGTRSHFSYSLRTFFDYGKYAIKAALLSQHQEDHRATHR